MASGNLFWSLRGNTFDLTNLSTGSISNAITAALSPLVPENLNDGHIVSLVLKKQWVLSPGNSKHVKPFLLVFEHFSFAWAVFWEEGVVNIRIQTELFGAPISSRLTVVGQLYCAICQASPLPTRVIAQEK